MPNVDAPDIQNAALNAINANLSQLAARQMGAVPAGAKFSVATNGTAITSVTPQTIAAAPGAGKALYLMAATVYNTTTGTPVITIADGAASPVTLAVISPGASPGVTRVVFEPPIAATTNKSVTGQANASAGSTLVLLELATG